MLPYPDGLFINFDLLVIPLKKLAGVTRIDYEWELSCDEHNEKLLNDNEVHTKGKGTVSIRDAKRIKGAIDLGLITIRDYYRIKMKISDGSGVSGFVTVGTFKVIDWENDAWEITKTVGSLLLGALIAAAIGYLFRG